MIVLLQSADQEDSLELQHFACAVYLHALKDLPAIVRLWWNDKDKTSASIIDKYVVAQCILVDIWFRTGYIICFLVSVCTTDQFLPSILLLDLHPSM